MLESKDNELLQALRKNALLGEELAAARNTAQQAQQQQQLATTATQSVAGGQQQQQQGGVTGNSWWPMLAGQQQQQRSGSAVAGSETGSEVWHESGGMGGSRWGGSQSSATPKWGSVAVQGNTLLGGFSMAAEQGKPIGRSHTCKVHFWIDILPQSDTAIPHKQLCSVVFLELVLVGFPEPTAVSAFVMSL
jgi:hypothetical protein